jgi:hypothetical protein
MAVKKINRSPGQQRSPRGGRRRSNGEQNPPQSPSPPPSGPGNTAASSFAFANTKPSADDFDTMDPKDIFADTNVKAPVRVQQFRPSRQPAVLKLADVLPSDDIKDINSTGSITFHSVGDTGGIKEPSKQFAVADAMAADLENKTYQTGRPAFFYHLGDVVYFLGQERYYYEQFYDPYRDYAAPIFAVPGNHDGMVAPNVQEVSLQGFMDNFCTLTPSRSPQAHGHARTTMTQPGVYFLLDAPFVKVIGLYSNTGEGTTQGVISDPTVGMAQLTFLQDQLASAAAARKKGDGRALLLAVHHPPFTGSSDHAPSPAMLKQIDKACKDAGIWPDMVLSGHAHLYERYTRHMSATMQIPYVVAGMGGYYNLSGFKKGQAGAKPKTPVDANDGTGKTLTLEKFNDVTFGFMRLTVSDTRVTCAFLGVDVDSKAVSLFDHFALDLDPKNHIVNNTL